MTPEPIIQQRLRQLRFIIKEDIKKHIMDLRWNQDLNFEQALEAYKNQLNKPTLTRWTTEANEMIAERKDLIMGLDNEIETQFRNCWRILGKRPTWFKNDQENTDQASQ